jgi:hypothetical protein
MTTEAGRIAAARRDAEQTAAEYDRKAQARLRELAALHGVTDPARLAQIAKSDPVLHDLVSSMFLAQRIPQVMLENGHVPVIGDMRDEAIRWCRSTHHPATQRPGDDR